eukprot:TRINITY_DN925_c0_g1_i2.p1 TRINITY_DN925_c0_g1~~TRINITY_DN925_c0_g1_i2.p1  ORF type:complete len:299 (-),score=56.42 TRINITY_DN925_c0_g1_i2:66-962(-)
MTITLKSGYESIQGRRWTMEDTHVLVDNATASWGINDGVQRAYYAVFDGHGGTDAADIAAERLHVILKESPSFLQGDMKEALEHAFMRTDDHILETGARMKWTNGTTAVVLCLVGTKLYIANAGDSEAVISDTSSGGAPQATLLSVKHKPSNERARIEAAGGHVIFGRVLGNLAVSRALGDAEFKMPLNRAVGNWVSAEPDVNAFDVTPHHTFLIIACDGLWDKMTYQEAVDFVAARKAEGKSPQETAELIVQESFNKGSTDNITTIIVYLDWPAEPAASSATSSSTTPVSTSESSSP